MSKKFVLLMIISLFTVTFVTGKSSLPAYASDGDFWDEPMKIDSEAKSQQKSVTNQEFEKVMQMFEKKKKKQVEKKKPKGNPVWQSSDEKNQNSISNVLKDIKQDYPTVMIPVTLITPNMSEITPGFYRILSAKRDNLHFINFYQGNSLVARVRAVDSGNDYNQKSINYAKIIPVSDDYMKVIYGDIDFNLEAELIIKK